MSENVFLRGETSSGGGNAGAVVVKDFIYAHQEELPANGLLGVSDNDVVYTSPADVREYDCFNFQQIVASGAVDIQVKHTADDTAWSDPVRFIDLRAANPLGARVVVTIGTVNRYSLIGKFYQIQVSQNGATGSNIVGSHCISNAGV